MATLTIRGVSYTLTMNSVLDKLARSSDPYLKKRLEEYVRPCWSSGSSFSHSLSDADLSRFAEVYGEQYVKDPWNDLDQYFAIIGKKLPHRKIRTQLKILYLFGPGNSYKPNLGSLSVAGEAVAGFCLQELDYAPLVRPLGIMPDAVLWKRQAGEFRLALSEAKASTVQEPRRMIEKNVYQFILDVKTRAAAFGNRYDAFLVCSRFRDGGGIDCECLHLDLGYYHAAKQSAGHCPEITDSIWSGMGGDYDARVRLATIIQAQAYTAETKDEYLAGLLSEEATRTATVALLEEKDEREIKVADVETLIRATASQLDVAEQWIRGQNLIVHTKQREEELVKRALQRYRETEFHDEE